MQIETIGKFQILLIANEVGSGTWAPFVTILRFDDNAQDFKCILEKQPAATHPLPSYNEAIDAARRVGTELVESGKL